MQIRMPMRQNVKYDVSKDSSIVDTLNTLNIFFALSQCVVFYASKNSCGRIGDSFDGGVLSPSWGCKNSSVVQKVDNAFPWINFDSVVNSIGFV